MKPLLISAAAALICSTFLFARKDDGVHTNIGQDLINGRPLSVTEANYSTLPPDTVHKNKLLFKHITTYNQQGLAVEGADATPSETSFKINYKYDDKTGKVTEAHSHTFDRYTTGYYNSKGQDTLRLTYHNDGTFYYKTAFAYNGQGLQSQYYTCDTGAGNMYLLQSYHYDKNNREIREDDYNKDGSLNYVVFYKYTAFDDHGNWTQRIRYGRFMNRGLVIPPTITDRSIVYAP